MAMVYAIGFVGLCVDRVERFFHHFLQFILHLLDVPEEILQALDPFKVADGDAARVGQDVRQDGDAVVPQDFIGLGSGRAVGGFDDAACLNVGRDVAIERVLSGGGNEDVAFAGKNFFIADRVGAGEIDERSVVAVEISGRGDVDAGFIENPAGAFADRDDRRADC